MEKEERKEIQERYADVIFPDPILEPVWYGKRPTDRVEGRYAVVDQNQNAFYAFCTDQYQLIHYEAVIKLMEDAVKDVPEFGNPIIVPTMLRDGGRMKVQATFKDVTYEIRKGDFINPTIDLFNSYDLGWKYGGRFGAFRLVCTNGLTVGKIFTKYSKRHLVSLDPKELTESIKVGMVTFSEQVGLWKKWAEKIVSAERYEKIWESLPFSTAEKEKIEALPEAETRLLLPDALKQEKLTVWDLNSVLTQYATHEVKSQLRQIEIQPLIARAMEMV